MRHIHLCLTSLSSNACMKATNFLRSFRTLPQTPRLGLLVGEEQAGTMCARKGRWGDYGRIRIF